MRRREFIAGVGGSLAVWPQMVLAQQPAAPVVGLLSGFAAQSPLVANFHRGLKEAGFVEGQNVVIDYRSSDGEYDRLPALAADLIKKQVAVISTLGENATLAVNAARIAAASKLPFVFSIGDDPVAMGVVHSLNRPEDNITGVTSTTRSLGPKRLELLHEFVPDATVAAVLLNAKISREAELSDIEEAARVFRWQLLVARASRIDELDTVFATLKREHVGALVIVTSAR
jgi:putative ABC transport system substrate-binding protein